MEDSARIHETLLALRRAWEAQPTLSFPQIITRLEMQGMGLNSTDSEVRELLESERAAHPLQLEEVPSRPALADLEGPARATIGKGWVALWGRLRPVVFSVDEVVECTVGRPLRIRDSHVHSLGRVTRLSELTPANADATFLLVLPDSGTALLRFTAERLSAVHLWKVGRREVEEQKIRVTATESPRLDEWGLEAFDADYGLAPAVQKTMLVCGTRGEELDIPAPQACYRLI